MDGFEGRLKTMSRLLDNLDDLVVSLSSGRSHISFISVRESIFMATISREVVRKIIEKTIKNGRHRKVVEDIKNRRFLREILEEGKYAKKMKEDGGSDWYRKKMVEGDREKEDIAYSAGIAKKTIGNIYDSQSEDTVRRRSAENYEKLEDFITEVSKEKGVKMRLEIEDDGGTVKLEHEETLALLSSFGVRREKISGSLDSSKGKNTEEPLLNTLCRIFNVPEEKYKYEDENDEDREIDFYLYDEDGERYNCEVKLMGKGNPETTDSAWARNTDVFIADRLSDSKKKQLSKKGIEWVELADDEGYTRFGKVLDELGVSHEKPSEVDSAIEKVKPQS